MESVKRTIEVTVSRDRFFDIISDYAAYPKFLSSLTGASIVQKTKTGATVEFHAKIIKSFRYTLKLSERRPTSLSWKLVDGDFMRQNEGRWSLKAIDAQTTEATYEIKVGLSRLVPSFITKVLVEQSLPETLEEFRRRAESSRRKSRKSTGK